MRGDRVHRQVVGLLKLPGGGQGGAGHARKPPVHAEVVLQADGGVGHRLGPDFQAFPGLHRLVQAIRPAPARHHAPGELVHDHHLFLVYQVMMIPFEQEARPQGLLQVADQVALRQAGFFRVARVDQRLPQQGRHVFFPARGQGDALIAGVDLHFVLAQPAHHLRHAGIPLDLAAVLARDDQRRARFVNQDVIHLVDDGKIVAALHLLGQAAHQVIAQVVETELAVGAIGDIGGIGFRPAGRTQPVETLLGRGMFRVETVASLDRSVIILPFVIRLQHPHAQPQPVKDGAHPARIPARQVIIDRHQVSAFPLQRAQVERQRGHQGLAFPGAHLGDRPTLQHDPADQLHIVMAQPQRAPGGLTHRGERLGQQVF